MIGQIFILLGVFLISGAKNGFFYSRNLNLNFAMIMVLNITMSLYTIAYGVEWTFLPIAIVLLWQTVIFQTSDSKQIHLSEYFLGFVLRIPFFFVTDIFMILSTIWLCDTFFKMPINIAVGRDLIERVDGTDDPEGKYVGTWFMGKHYKVPRLLSNGYTKLYVGLAVFFAWVVAYHFGLRLSYLDLF